MALSHRLLLAEAQGEAFADALVVPELLAASLPLREESGLPEVKELAVGAAVPLPLLLPQAQLLPLPRDEGVVAPVAVAQGMPLAVPKPLAERVAKDVGKALAAAQAVEEGEGEPEAVKEGSSLRDTEGLPLRTMLGENRPLLLPPLSVALDEAQGVGGGSREAVEVRLRGALGVLLPLALAVTCFDAEELSAKEPLFAEDPVPLSEARPVPPMLPLDEVVSVLLCGPLLLPLLVALEWIDCESTAVCEAVGEGAGDELSAPLAERLRSGEAEAEVELAIVAPPLALPTAGVAVPDAATLLLAAPLVEKLAEVQLEPVLVPPVPQCEGSGETLTLRLPAPMLPLTDVLPEGETQLEGAVLALPLGGEELLRSGEAEAVLPGLAVALSEKLRVGSIVAEALPEADMGPLGEAVLQALNEAEVQGVGLTLEGGAGGAEAVALRLREAGGLAE